MKVTITTLADLVLTLDVAADMELENFKTLCALETNMDPKRVAIFFNGNVLVDPLKTLTQYGIQDGDMVLVQDTLVMNQSVQQAAAASGGGRSMTPNSLLEAVASMNVPDDLMNLPDPRQESESIFNALGSNPEQLAMLRVNNPRLANAFSNGIDEFASVLREQQDARAQEHQRRIRMLMADPFDLEAQRMIAEEIRRQQINSNMESAIEYLPESFAEVCMLYINCKVNGFPMKAFVDSGAQSTIMSKACAERCNILRLIDDRWSGIARGVGTQKILGKIHLVQLEINGDFLPSSFTILEHQPMDMLFGLDMLRRYQCSIDLQKGVLRIGTTGTETPFLHESEIPKFAKLPTEENQADIQRAIQESLNLQGNQQQSKPKLPVQNATTDHNNSQTSRTTPMASNIASSSQSTKCKHSEPVIQEIVALGFPRDQVIQELDASGGDKNQAIGALFAKALVVPKDRKR